MDFGQGVEATGPRTRECVCVCVRLCELLTESMLLFPVTCRFEVGGRERKDPIRKSSLQQRLQVSSVFAQRDAL